MCAATLCTPTAPFGVVNFQQDVAPGDTRPATGLLRLEEWCESKCTPQANGDCPSGTTCTDLTGSTADQLIVVQRLAYVALCAPAVLIVLTGVLTWARISLARPAQFLSSPVAAVGLLFNVAIIALFLKSDAWKSFKSFYPDADNAVPVGAIVAGFSVFLHAITVVVSATWRYFGWEAPDDDKHSLYDEHDAAEQQAGDAVLQSPLQPSFDGGLMRVNPTFRDGRRVAAAWGRTKTPQGQGVEMSSRSNPHV